MPTPRTGFDVMHTGTLVLGSGLAGLYAALRAADRGDVVIATHGRLQESSSWYAQGGVAAALGEDDTVELHEADTLRVGRGLCRMEAVELLTEEGPQHVRRLRELGVDFELEGGRLDLGLEAGHSRRRVAHAGGGNTGRVIVDSLVRLVLDHPNIQVLNHTPSWQLVSDGERCYGAHTTRGCILAGTTILATGGAASLYARSTNPAGSRGQGMALAWNAGAALVDMEFVQFHPTALALAGPGNGFLVSEAVRGEGAQLLNVDGERFMPDRHPLAELAPRDELTRAIVEEMDRTGHHCVYLTLQHMDADAVDRRFGAIAERLRSVGLDLAGEPIPVAPAAHYVMGGVMTDLDGRSTLDGLLACGEVACTGVHGANRLASNSLLECLVFADRAGAVHGAIGSVPPELVRVDVPDRALTPVDASVQQLLWEFAGVVRTAGGLGRLADLDPGTASTSVTGRSDVLVASLIGRAALARHESRGSHHRADHPSEDPSWEHHLMLDRRSGVSHVEWGSDVAACR